MKKYKSLRFIAAALQAISFLSAIGSITIFFLDFKRSESSGLFLLYTIGICIIAVFIYAFADLIYVQIDNEENTRKTSLILEEILKSKYF